MGCVHIWTHLVRKVLMISAILVANVSKVRKIYPTTLEIV